MKKCHVCLYLCEDSAEICPVCGAELSVREEDAVVVKAEENSGILTPVLAVSADSPVTVEIFKDILLENSIPYSEDRQGDIMHTGFGGSYFATDIYVDEKDLETAKMLYKNLTEQEMVFDDFDCENDGEE